MSRNLRRSTRASARRRISAQALLFAIAACRPGEPPASSTNQVVMGASVILNRAALAYANADSYLAHGEVTAYSRCGRDGREVVDRGRFVIEFLRPGELIFDYVALGLGESAGGPLYQIRVHKNGAEWSSTLSDGQRTTSRTWICAMHAVAGLSHGTSLIAADMFRGIPFSLWNDGPSRLVDRVALGGREFYIIERSSEDGFVTRGWIAVDNNMLYKISERIPIEGKNGVNARELMESLGLDTDSLGEAVIDSELCGEWELDIRFDPQPPSGVTR